MLTVAEIMQIERQKIARRQPSEEELRRIPVERPARIFGRLSDPRQIQESLQSMAELIDLVKLARQVAKELQKIKKPIKVAVMGCVVNGPGEAADADVGIACGKGKGILFRNGKKIGVVKEANYLTALMDEVNKL